MPPPRKKGLANTLIKKRFYQRDPRRKFTVSCQQKPVPFPVLALALTSLDNHAGVIYDTA